MLGRIDWIVDNIVPFQKEVFPDDPDDDEPVTVKVLEDEPGGGKTRYARSEGLLVGHQQNLAARQ